MKKYILIEQSAENTSSFYNVVITDTNSLYMTYGEDWTELFKNSLAATLKLRENIVEIVFHDENAAKSGKYKPKVITVDYNQYALLGMLHSASNKFLDKYPTKYLFLKEVNDE